MCGLQIRQKRRFGQFLNLYSALTCDEFLTILKALFFMRIQEKKMNLFKISRFPILSNVSPIFHNVSSIFHNVSPIISQCFPDFSLTKFFKVRKCERCGILNPRLSDELHYKVKAHAHSLLTKVGRLRSFPNSSVVIPFVFH